jgi:hypothetical protein
MLLVRNTPILMVILLLASCASPAVFQMPEITETTSNVESVDFEGVLVNHDLLLSNLQDFPATTRLERYELRAGEVLISGADLDVDVELNAQEERNIVVPALVSFNSLRPEGGLLPEREELPYRMLVFTSARQSGDNSNAAESVILRDTLDFGGSIPLVERPRLYPDTLMLRSFNLAIAELELRVRVVNPGAFPITLNDISFVVSVDDIQWHAQQIGQTITVPARSDIVFDAPFSMRPRNFSTQVYRYLNMNESFEFTLSGDALISVPHPAFGRPERWMFTRTDRQQF